MTSWSVKLLNLMGTLLSFSAMKIHVAIFSNSAGLTVGDPVERTKQPLSV